MKRERDGHPEPKRVQLRGEPMMDEQTSSLDQMHGLIAELRKCEEQILIINPLHGELFIRI